MRVQCPNTGCNSFFDINDQRLIPGKPRKVRCAYCRLAFFVKQIDNNNMEVDAKEEQLLPDGTLVLNIWNRPKNYDPPSFTEYKQLRRQGVSPQAPPPSPSLEQDANVKIYFLSDIARGAGNTIEIPKRIEKPQPLSLKPVFQKLNYDTATIAAMLKKWQWTDVLDPDSMLVFAQYWDLFLGKTNSPLFQKGDRNSFLCIIDSGEIHLFSSYEDAAWRKEPLLILGPGDSLGEQSIFHTYNRESVAIIKKETSLLILTRKRAKEMLQNHPTLWQWLVRKVALMMVNMIMQKITPFQGDVFCHPILTSPDSYTPEDS